MPNSSFSPTSASPSYPQPKFLLPNEAHAASARPARLGRTHQKLHKLCCPACGETLLDYFIPYVNHGVMVSSSHVITAKGELRTTPAMRFLVTALLEAYPNEIAYQSLLILYENMPEVRDSQHPLGSLRVQISKFRKELASLGINFRIKWGFGFRLELSL